MSTPRSHFSLVMLLLVMVSLLVSPACSSRAVFQEGFRVNLRHVDSYGNYTKLELLQRGIKRGIHRLARLKSLACVGSNSGNSPSFETPIYSGTGAFLMNVSIGTPSVSYVAFMDTGSDLIWTQCKPCEKCYKQSTPIFDRSQSSSYSKVSCSSKFCNALKQSVCDNGCRYTYRYGDSSATQGIIARETFKFNKVSVRNVAFGCGINNDGFSPGEGLVGLGRGALSLVSQLKSRKFSYCLTSINDRKSSPLLFGSLATSVGKDAATKSTPLITNPSQPTFYYLSLEDITVGDRLLSIPKSAFQLRADGMGGIIIDSGTTFTSLEKSAFDLVKKAFVEQSTLSFIGQSINEPALEVCFSLPADASNVEVPKLIFHFTGVDLDLPSENFMTEIADEGSVCLAMVVSHDISVFGNIQQQNMLVLHDLDKKTISITPTQCDQL